MAAFMSRERSSLSRLADWSSGPGPDPPVRLAERLGFEIHKNEEDLGVLLAKRQL